MKRLVSFLSLFTSVGTLVCCALPALFVVLGMGAALSGFVGVFPQIVWLSERKALIFGIGAAFLLVGGLLQWKSRSAACPVDSKLGSNCATTKDWSGVSYLLAVGAYVIGFFFAYIAPKLLF